MGAVRTDVVSRVRCVGHIEGIPAAVLSSQDFGVYGGGGNREEEDGIGKT